MNAHSSQGTGTWRVRIVKVSAEKSNTTDIYTLAIGNSAIGTFVDREAFAASPNEDSVLDSQLVNETIVPVDDPYATVVGMANRLAESLGQQWNGDIQRLDQSDLSAYATEKRIAVDDLPYISLLDVANWAEVSHNSQPIDGEYADEDTPAPVTSSALALVEPATGYELNADQLLAVVLKHPGIYTAAILKYSDLDSAALFYGGGTLTSGQTMEIASVLRAVIESWMVLWKQQVLHQIAAPHNPLALDLVGLEPPIAVLVDLRLQEQVSLLRSAQDVFEIFLLTQSTCACLLQDAGLPVTARNLEQVKQFGLSLTETFGNTISQRLQMEIRARLN